MKFYTKLFFVLFLFVASFSFFAQSAFAETQYCDSMPDENTCCHYTYGTLSGGTIFSPQELVMLLSCLGGGDDFPPVCSAGGTQCYTFGGGGGGGGGSPLPPEPPVNTPAVVSVLISGINPGLITWMLNPGSHTGNGDSAVLVFPESEGTVYGLSGLAYAGCSYEVTNTSGIGSSMTIFPGSSNAFFVQYYCGNPPTVDIQINNSQGPVALSAGQSGTLSWTSTNANTCTASGSWLGSKAISGSESTGSLSSGTYTYTIRCEDTGGTKATDSVVVNVSGTPPPAPTITATASATCASVDISWSGYNTALSTGFKIYRNGVLVATIGNTTSYTDSNLSAGSYTYTVIAFNGSGDSTTSNSSSASASAQCVGPVPIVTLTANPTSTETDTTLTWTTTNSPSSCTASNDASIGAWSGGKSVAGGSQVILNITRTTIFSLYCTNSSGQSATQNVTVTYLPKAGQRPVVTLTALPPYAINSGQSAQLTWTATNNPTSCTASRPGQPNQAPWTGSKTPRSGGSEIISNITDTYTYRLTCSNASGSGFADVDIPVGSDPSYPYVQISANPNSVTSGQSTVIKWTPVLNATYCEGKPQWPHAGNAQWNGPKSLAGGTQTITNLTSSTYFMISCVGPGGSLEPSTYVTVSSVAPATLNVTSNNASASWSISPGGIVGSGLSGNYSVTPNPSGNTYTISPNTLPGYTTTVSSTLNGVAGGGSAVPVFPGDTATYAITYTSTGPTFDYTLSNPGNLTINKSSVPVVGEQKSTFKLLTQGTTQIVDTNVTGLPSGVSLGWSNRACSPSPSCTTFMTFTVDPSAPIGTHNLVLRGITAGLADKTQNFDLVISNTSPLSVNVSSNPSSTAQVGQSVTWTCTPSGGSGTYTYTWSGTGVPTPAPTTSSFTTTYQTVGSKPVVCTVNDGTQSAGSLERAVQVSVNPIFIEF